MSDSHVIAVPVEQESFSKRQLQRTTGRHGYNVTTDNQSVKCEINAWIASVYASACGPFKQRGENQWALVLESSNLRTIHALENVGDITHVIVPNPNQEELDLIEAGAATTRLRRVVCLNTTSHRLLPTLRETVDQCQSLDFVFLDYNGTLTSSRMKDFAVLHLMNPQSPCVFAITVSQRGRDIFYRDDLIDLVVARVRQSCRAALLVGCCQYQNAALASWKREPKTSLSGAMLTMCFVIRPRAGFKVNDHLVASRVDLSWMRGDEYRFMAHVDDGSLAWRALEYVGSQFAVCLPLSCTRVWILDSKLLRITRALHCIRPKVEVTAVLRLAFEAEFAQQVAGLYRLDRIHVVHKPNIGDALCESELQCDAIWLGYTHSVKMRNIKKCHEWKQLISALEILSHSASTQAVLGIEMNYGHPSEVWIGSVTDWLVQGVTTAAKAQGFESVRVVHVMRFRQAACCLSVIFQLGRGDSPLPRPNLLPLFQPGPGEALPGLQIDTEWDPLSAPKRPREGCRKKLVRMQPFVRKLVAHWWPEGVQSPVLLHEPVLLYVFDAFRLRPTFVVSQDAVTLQLLRKADVPVLRDDRVVALKNTRCLVLLEEQGHGVFFDCWHELIVEWTQLDCDEPRCIVMMFTSGRKDTDWQKMLKDYCHGEWNIDMVEQFSVERRHVTFACLFSDNTSQEDMDKWREIKPNLWRTK